MSSNKILVIFLLIELLNTTSCGQKNNNTKHHFEGNSFVLGQWYTDNKDHPHWIMFDSLNNFYKWNFDETIPKKPFASFTLKDSIVHFKYPPEFGLKESIDSLWLDSLSNNSFTILPIDSRIMERYTYRRDNFRKPEFAEIFIYFLTKNETDSLTSIGNTKAHKERISNMSNFEDIYYELEFSWIRSFHINSTYVITRDSSFYNKFNIGHYGIIYYKNDSTLIRPGIPGRGQFRQELKDFFPFVNQ